MQPQPDATPPAEPTPEELRAQARVTAAMYTNTMRRVRYEYTSKNDLRQIAAQAVAHLIALHEAIGAEPEPQSGLIVPASVGELIVKP